MLRTSVDNFGDLWVNSNSTELFWSCMELVNWGLLSQYVVSNLVKIPTFGFLLVGMARDVDKFQVGLSQLVP